MTTPAPEAEIRDLVDTRNRTLHDKDATALADCYASDIVTFSLAPPLASQGFDVDGTSQWMRSWDGPITYEVTRWRLSVSGDVAFAHSLDRMHGERAGEPPTDLWFRSTTGFAHVDGRWVITHEHQSVPMSMDGTGKALVDLTP